MKLNLASTRLAFLLIAALLLLIMLSAIIPQDDISSGQIIDWQEKLGDGYYVIDKLGLNRIYYTPTFFIVLGLLAINLTVGNIKRFRAVYRIEKTFLRLRHLGSVLFHLSLLLVMAGVILHFLFKFEGVFSLTEGQTVNDQSAEYHREYQGPLHAASYGNFSLKLEEIGHAKREVDSLGSVARVTLMPTRSTPQTADIAINSPFVWGEYEFHFGSATGYSPELLLIDSTGATAFRSFMRISRRDHVGQDVHFDFLELDQFDLRMEIEVLPIGARPDSVEYQVEIFRSDSTLFEGRLSSADTVAFAGYKFNIPRLRRWCYIGAIKNPYLYLIFAGFWCALAGLSLSLLGRLAVKRT